MSYVQKSLIWILAILFLFLLHAIFFTPLNFDSLIFLFLICFFSEFVDSSLGMGYGTMLMPFLLLVGYTPREVIPNLLISELLTGFSAVFFHHEIKNFSLALKSNHLKIVILLAIGSVIGVTIGVWVSLSVATDIVEILIGCIIVFSGIVVLLFYNKVIVYKNWKIVLLSLIASFNKAFSGGGYGPLVTSGQILSGIEGRASVGITAFSEGFTCLLAVIVLYLNNVETNFITLVPMISGGLISVPFSAFIVSRSQERHLRVAVGTLTMILGICTVYSIIKT